MLSSIPAAKLTAFRVEVARLAALPELQVPDGQDQLIADRINNYPSVVTVRAIPVAEIRNTIIFANSWPSLEAAAKATDPKGIAARNVQLLCDPALGMDPLDATNAERLGWFDAQLAALVAGNVISTTVKTAVLALKDATVSWAEANLGDTVSVTLVSQNKP